MINATTVATAVSLCLVIYWQYFVRNSKPRLPPGPKYLPIIGNIMDLPPKGVPEYQHWLKHKDEYGPISSVTVMGTTIVIIHDKTSAQELLVTKSSKTSSRPHMEFGLNMCDYNKLLALSPFNDCHRRRRKLVHQHFGTKAMVTQYSHVQEVEARRFLLRVLKEPDGLVQHIQSETAAVILKVTYGYSLEPHTADPLLSLVETMIDNIRAALVPMAWFVDIIPALKYLPSGFPGTAFKETARQWRKTGQDVANIPYLFVKKQRTMPNPPPSFVSYLLNEKSNGQAQPTPDDEEDIKWSAATIYGAGAETTTGVLTGFVLAMVLFPGVQRKAQEEIDRVIGSERLPKLEDRDKLLYIGAVVREAYRWLPVSPMGLPHVSHEDIVYKGHLIPKGAYLLPAVWWFCHDPDVYTDPSSFDPERYLAPREEPDATNIVFGYGRRTCPGQHFADATVFITIAQVLAAFSIKRAVDDQGVEIEAKVEVTPSVTAHPKPFPYSIAPRSSRYAELVRNIEVEAPWTQNDVALF